MFKVRGKLILTPEIDVIESLRNELHRRGIYKLNKIKKLKSNIMVCCPIHNNGQEKESILWNINWRKRRNSTLFYMWLWKRKSSLYR